MANDDDEQLILFGADGVELKRIFSLDMRQLKHAVETSRGTFIVAYHKPSVQVSEIDTYGAVMRIYSDELTICGPRYLAIDPDDRVFVAGYTAGQVLLLNSRLELEAGLLDKHSDQLMDCPSRLSYAHDEGQLVVGSEWRRNVQIFMVRTCSDKGINGSLCRML